MNLTPTQLRLISLLGDKTLSFGCIIKNKNGLVFVIKTIKNGIPHIVGNLNGDTDYLYSKDTEILGHVPNIGDLHRMIATQGMIFTQTENQIYARKKNEPTGFAITYTSSKDLIDQDVATLDAIISLIESVGVSPR